jgi:hypothetical protein
MNISPEQQPKQQTPITHDNKAAPHNNPHKANTQSKQTLLHLEGRRAGSAMTSLFRQNIQRNLRLLQFPFAACAYPVYPCSF